MAYGTFEDERIARLDVPAPRYTSYPTVLDWRPSFGADAYGRALAEAARAGADASLSLYVHLPFCPRMCAYCGCNVVVTKDPRRLERYLDDLAREMDLVAERLGSRRSVAQMHWGGGTPTFLDAAQIRRLRREIDRRFRILPDAEASIEVDPRSTPPEKLELLRALGFDRISVGLQDLDEAVQWAVDRWQPESETTSLIALARRLGFRSIGVDLICGLPLQIERSWRETVERVVELGPDRIAVYSLAYVPTARPHQRRLDRFPRAEGAEKLALQRVAGEILESAGYRPIGFDHYALPSDDLARAEAEGRLQRSFQGYTVRRAPDLVGLGVTAIGDVGGVYAQNARSLVAYGAAVRSGRLATERGIALSDGDRRRRRRIEHLLCRMTLDLRGEEDLESIFAELAPLERDGVVRIDGSRITITPFGRPFARLVAMAFDEHRGRVAHPLARAI